MKNRFKILVLSIIFFVLLSQGGILTVKANSLLTESSNIEKTLVTEYINITNFQKLEGDVSDFERIVRAIDTVSSGETLYFPSATYNLGSNALNITKTMNILGEEKPIYSKGKLIKGTIFENGKVTFQGSNQNIKNIGLYSPTLDNGFGYSGAIIKLRIDNCTTIVSAHGFLFESYLGYINDVIVSNSDAYDSIHGFISKADNITFINCNAWNMKKDRYGYGFGFISDNIPGAEIKGICINNKAINCNVYNSPYGFHMYSRDYFSTTNSNNIKMSKLTLTNCSANKCTRAYNFGDNGIAPDGRTNNKVYDINVVDCVENECGSALEFNRCDNVYFKGTVKHGIYFNGDVTNYKIDLTKDSTGFAKSFPLMGNMKPNKVWVIKFNRDVKSINVSIKNKENEYIECTTDISGNKITITPVENYSEGEYLLEIKEAKALDNSILKETVVMKFTIKR